MSKSLLLRLPPLAIYPCSRSSGAVWTCVTYGRRLYNTNHLPLKAWRHRPSVILGLQTSQYETCNAQFRAFSASRMKLSDRIPQKSPQQYKQLTSSSHQPPPKKPLLQQTADLSSKLRARFSQNLTHENIYTLPNILTFSRLIAAPVVGYLVLHDAHAWAGALFIYAGLTDLVDGWIARRWNLQTVVGTVIDPLADKALMTILTVCLAVQGGLPIWLATLILGRDISLAIAAIYYRYASLPAPKSFARYWDFSLPSAQVHPTGISKANTFLQLVLIGATTFLPVAGQAADVFLSSVSNGGVGIGGVMTGAQWLVATTTVWSGASYLYTRHAVEILGDGTPERKIQILTRGRLILGASFVTCFGVALALESLNSDKQKAVEGASLGSES